MQMRRAQQDPANFYGNQSAVNNKSPMWDFADNRGKSQNYRANNMSDSKQFRQDLLSSNGKFPQFQSDPYYRPAGKTGGPFHSFVSKKQN